MDENQHKMILRETFGDGPNRFEEWYCPTCGRRFLLRWPPHYKREILDEGDLYAIHTANIGQMQLDGADILPPLRDEQQEAENIVPYYHDEDDPPEFRKWAEKSKKLKRF